MKRNAFAILLAVMLVVALVFVVAPSAQAETIITAEAGKTYNIIENGKTLDLNGQQNVTVNIVDGITLSVVDSGNTDMDGSTAGSLVKTGEGTIAPVAFDGNSRYLTIEENGTYSFHPFYLSITAIGLNTVSKDVCLRVSFGASEVVKAKITDYGVVRITGEKLTASAAEKYPFGSKNGVHAYYDLKGSLDSGNLDASHQFRAYMVVNGVEVLSNFAPTISPREVLKAMNNAATVEKATETQKAAIAEMATNAHLADLFTSFTGAECTHSAMTESKTAVCKNCDSYFDMTAIGSAGDAIKGTQSIIALPEAISGDAVELRVGDGVYTEGFTYADGKLTMTAALVDEIYGKLSYGEKTVKLYASDEKCYAFTATFVTKAIGTLEELKSIAVSGNTLDGYYILTNDIDCGGKNFYLVGTGGANPSQGFIGVFDGRGHAINRFETAWGLFYTIGGGVVKNIAFTNTIGNRPVLANVPVHGATIENIFVSGEGSHLVGGLWHATTVKNVVFASNYANAATNDTGGDSVNVLNNVFVVGAAVHGYLNTTPSLTNTKVFADTNALLIAMGVEGELDKWAGSGFTMEDGKLFFFGREVIAPTNVNVYEEIDLTDKGNMGDLETSENYSYINLPSEIQGNVTGVSFGGSDPFTDVSVADGKLAIAKAGVTAIYNAAGYTEQKILIHTDSGKNYAVKVSIVTKAIGTLEELKSIATRGNVLDGYYVLTADIDCQGQNFYLVYSGNKPEQGFIGTFDGRGHAIDRFQTAWGFFYSLGAGVVKNIAFTNTIGDRPILANGETHGSTIENIFVSGESKKLVGGLWDGAKLKNIVFASGNGNATINETGGNAVNTMTNVFVVGTDVHGYLNTTPVLNNAKAFADSSSLIAALSAEGEMDKWAGSGFSVENGKLLFFGRAYIG